MEYRSGLRVLSYNPKLIGTLCSLIGSMPNIDFPTMGGHFCWDTLAESNGWQLQKNKFTDHCRILDSSNIRKAWGSEDAMKRALCILSEDYDDKIRSIESNNNNNKVSVYCSSCGNKVPNGKFCRECGSRME